MASFTGKGTLTQFQQKLLRSFFVEFYAEFGREFPWRLNGTTPFQLLLAEMLLRQTQADQVVPCWRVLTERVQAPGDILEMSKTEIQEIVAPLGLANQRSTALIACSSVLAAEHNGVVPRSLDILTKLPHVGVYTANAVACFAFETRLPIIDGNVLRVLSRFTNTDFGRDNRRSTAAIELSWLILPRTRFKEHNWGLLDFAATVCKSRNPHHIACRLRHSCQCYKAGQC